MRPAAQGTTTTRTRIAAGCMSGIVLGLLGLGLHCAGGPAETLLTLLPLLPLGTLLGAGWHAGEQIVARLMPGAQSPSHRPARPSCRLPRGGGLPRWLLLAPPLAGRAPPTLADCR